jgi:1-acyl-sn-glycerol-3-phosphate acyltransferase
VPAVRRIAEHALALGGLVAVTVFAIAVSPLIWPFAVLPTGVRERYAIRGAQVFGWLCLHALLFARVTVVGKERLPARDGYLVISNHRSWADVALLILHTKSQGISKKEVAYVPFFGLNGYLSGAIFFDRKLRSARAKVVHDAIARMKAGGNLHVFPEGTRTRDGRIQQKVFLRLVEECYDAGIPVVPACTWDTERAVQVGGFRARAFQSIGLEIGDPRVGESHADKESFARAAWQRVVEMAAARGSDREFVHGGRG